MVTDKQRALSNIKTTEEGLNYLIELTSHFKRESLPDSVQQELNSLGVEFLFRIQRIDYIMKNNLG